MTKSVEPVARAGPQATKRQKPGCICRQGLEKYAHPAGLSACEQSAVFVLAAVLMCFAVARAREAVAMGSRGDESLPTLTVIG